MCLCSRRCARSQFPAPALIAGRLVSSPRACVSSPVTHPEGLFFLFYPGYVLLRKSPSRAKLS